MRRTLSCLFDLVENGSNELLTQMLDIDDAFITQILSLSDSVESLLLIVTLVCCSVTLLLTLFYLPYLFSLEKIQQQMIEFTAKTSKEEVTRILTNCKNFSEYIERNNYLNQPGMNDEEDAETHKT